MPVYYWNDWYSGWGWFLWFGVFFLFFSAVGNWGYTYRAHRKLYGYEAQKNALAILNERFARGEINEQEYVSIKAHITPSESKSAANKMAKNNLKDHVRAGTPIHSNT